LRIPPIGAARLFLLAILAGCAGREAPKTRPGPRRAPATRPSAASLVVTLEDGSPEERRRAEARLIARGRGAVPAVERALAEANRETRIALLGILEELGRLPEDLDPAERATLTLWRLAGGHGSAADRTRTLARLAVADEGLREALAVRAGQPGTDRALALFALSATGHESAVSVLSSALDAKEEPVRRAAAAGLRRLTGVDWEKAGSDQRARLLREWEQDATGRQG